MQLNQAVCGKRGGSRAVSSSAFAQATIAPFTGVTFGGDTTDNRFVYGAMFGFGGNVGFDVDFGYAPNFFGDNDEFGDLDGKLNITTLMFNIRFGGNPAQRRRRALRLRRRRTDARQRHQPVAISSTMSLATTSR